MAHGRSLPLDRANAIAIINTTPDSFSDGGDISTPDDAVGAARRAIDDGAAMLDIGGESTRPGAQRVGAQEQIRRVVPAIEAIRCAGIACPISVDTTLSPVAQAALDAGADAINDVAGGTEDDAILPLAAARACGLVLMHRLRPPDRDRFSTRYRGDAPDYSDQGGVVAAVGAFLRRRAEAARRAGVAHEAIVLDPGLGFGKTPAQNFALIAGAGALLGLGYPLLSAASRKSFLAHHPDQPAKERVHASVAVSVAQRQMGVSLFRVHDVAAHVAALRAADAVLRARAAGEQPPAGAG